MKKLKQPLLNYKQTEWNGIAVGFDPTDIPPENATEAYNVDLQIEGELTSMKGAEKQITTGLGYAIDFLWQLYKHLILNYMFSL